MRAYSASSDGGDGGGGTADADIGATFSPASWGGKSVGGGEKKDGESEGEMSAEERERAGAGPSLRIAFVRESCSSLD
eukprot:scaffold51457_cov33-Tisochrysis_lutea.AAC.1